MAAECMKETADLLQRHGKSLLRSGMPGVVREAALFLSARGARPPVAAALLGEACRLAGDHAAAAGHFEVAPATRGDGSAGITRDPPIPALQGLAYPPLQIGRPAP